MALLAKSDGTTLEQHSQNVAEVAVYMAKKTLGENPYSAEDFDILEVVRLAGLLHDVGKATKGFQNFLIKDKEVGSKYQHNETAWAIITKYFNANKNYLKLIAESVYWHHGIRNKFKGYTNSDVLESMKLEDVESIKNTIKSLCGEDCIIQERENYLNAPQYFYEGEEVHLNQHLNFVRMCLLSADKLVSELESTHSVEQIYQKIDEVVLRAEIKINNCPYPDEQRFNLQKEIVEQCSKTSIPKAPAGFGKTMLGILWAAKSNKKILWVCPRNSVAESVYNSVNNELNALGINNINVELFLTGEIKKIRHSIPNLQPQPFEADIIITNIDSFISPTVESKHSSKLFFLNCTDVIFDEFHELVTEGALFASFVDIMRLRHQKLDVRTLLLSATPIQMNHLWDSLALKTTILPNEEEHYQAAHNKEYQIFLQDEFNPQEGINDLFIFNSIQEAQIFKSQKENAELIHSEFLEAEKTQKFSKIYNDFGKLSDRNKDKYNLIGTHIVQAGWDISFQNLYESVLSPESTLQRIGRIDRWGDYQNTAKINVFKLPKSKSENMIRDILYSRNISDLWFDYLKQYSGQKLTLNQFYKIYNQFNSENREVIKKFVNKTYRDSLSNLINIYSIKFVDKKSNKKIKTAGGNKFRSNGTEVFYIVKNYNNNTWTDVFSTKIYKSIADDFKEEGDVRGKILRVMKNLRNSNDERFEFNEILDQENNINLDNLRKYARKSNTPYVRFDKVYHPIFGLTKIELLENLL